MKNAVKALQIMCLGASFASFFFGISFYYRDLPNRPRPELGRIYPLNNHGYLLYLTRQEHQFSRCGRTFSLSCSLLSSQSSTVSWTHSVSVVAKTCHGGDRLGIIVGGLRRASDPGQHTAIICRFRI